MQYLRIIVLLFIVLCQTYATGQYFDLGQDPASVKWKQINTPGYKIIFPEEFESRAQYLANRLEMTKEKMSYTLSSHQRKFPVIIHNRDVTSNALVPWAPRRMEIYTTTPRDSYPQPWLDQLVLHELRHVVQVEKMNQGATKVLGYIFGEQAAAAMIGLFVPFWYLEGDAVAVETAMSFSGRGRQPSFQMPLKAQLVEKGSYSYDKAYYGSFRNFVPNWYILGYHMMLSSRKRFGAGMWDSTLNLVARRPYYLAPLSVGIKKNTGLRKKELYNQSMNDMIKYWDQGEFLVCRTGPFEIISKFNAQYTSYNHVKDVGGGNYFALKSSIDDIDRFVLIDSKLKEKTIHIPGYFFDENISYASGKVVWAEKKYDPRWDNRSYSEIKTLEINTGKVNKLTQKTRYFSPALSPDGKLIAVTEQTQTDQFYLVIIDSESGEPLQRFPYGDNQIFMPSWSTNGEEIVYIVLNENGKNLETRNITNNNLLEVTGFSFWDILYPTFFGEYILFNGTFDGNDNIYAIHKTNKNLYRATNSKIGITQPSLSIDGEKLLCSEYTSDGFRGVVYVLDSTLWEPVRPSEFPPLLYPGNIVKEENYIYENDTSGFTTYPVKKYREISHLFKFHSWAPLAINADNQTFNPGISVLSQNHLSTLFLSAGYEYKLNENTGKIYADISYRKFYPTFEFTLESGRRRSTYTNDENTEQEFTWYENRFTASANLPLRFVNGQWSTGIYPFVSTSLINIKHENSTPHDFVEGTLQSLEYRMYLFNQSKSSYRDLSPKWAQIVDLNFRNTPFSDISLGTIWSAEGYLYFPGIVKHHSLRFYIAYQKKQESAEDYRFSDLIDYPRGYNRQFNDELRSFAATYSFPIIYPDLSLGPLAYIKRIKSQLYFGYAEAKQDEESNYYKSAGVDLTFDMHILRFLAPFDLGLRSVYIFDDNLFKFEFLYSLNVSALYKNPDNHQKPIHHW